MTSNRIVTVLGPLILYEVGGLFGLSKRRFEFEKDVIGMRIPTIDLVKTGKNIIHLREERGLTVKDLQRIFGFTTPQAIYKWQHGDALPTVDNLVVLAKVFSVRVDDIIVLCQSEGGIE